MAHPVLESHGKALRVAFKALADKIACRWACGSGYIGASQQLPIGDAIAHGSFCVLQISYAFPVSESVTGEHMSGSPSAHQACLVLDLGGSFYKAASVVCVVTGVTDGHVITASRFMPRHPVGALFAHWAPTELAA
eukprot:1159067-Pelagomonas_calceolata.AAC.8